MEAQVVHGEAIARVAEQLGVYGARGEFERRLALGALRDDWRFLRLLDTLWEGVKALHDRYSPLVVSITTNGGGDDDRPKR